MTMSNTVAVETHQHLYKTQSSTLALWLKNSLHYVRVLYKDGDKQKKVRDIGYSECPGSKQRNCGGLLVNLQIKFLILASLQNKSSP